MQITVVPALELEGKQIACWEEIRRGGQDYRNPYFSPLFTLAVAAVRSNVFVAVLIEGSQTVGFFPYQRGRFGVGRPAGGAFSSYQGVIAVPGIDFTAQQLLRGCRLNSYSFTHLLDSPSQKAFEPYFAVRTGSPVMDTSDGYQSYERKRQQMGGTQLKHTHRMMRKLGRDKGEYKFVRHTPDLSVLRQLLTWKSAQCLATGIPDMFANPWTVKLMEKIHSTQTADFGGVLSALYVGDKLIAAEIDIRSSTVWHRWITAYDRDYASYSPGVILGLEMAKAAAAEGVVELDMGKDMTFYKETMMTASVPLATGQVELPSLSSAVRSGYRSLEAWVRRSPMVGIARVPGRWIKRLERKARFN